MDNYSQWIYNNGNKDTDGPYVKRETTNPQNKKQQQ